MSINREISEFKTVAHITIISGGNVKSKISYFAWLCCNCNAKSCKMPIFIFLYQRNKLCVHNFTRKRNSLCCTQRIVPFNNSQQFICISGTHHRITHIHTIMCVHKRIYHNAVAQHEHHCLINRRKRIISHFVRKRQMCPYRFSVLKKSIKYWYFFKIRNIIRHLSTACHSKKEKNTVYNSSKKLLFHKVNSFLFFSMPRIRYSKL